MTPNTEVASAKEGNVRVSVTLGIKGDADRHPLAVIRGITTGIKSMEPMLRDAVHQARELRHTWEEIGDALGVTRQSAQERFRTE